MKTNISSKEELLLYATNLEKESIKIIENFENIKSVISNVNDYDNISISKSGNILANNLMKTSQNLKNASNNIKKYAMSISDFDNYDFNIDEVETER